MLLDELHAKKDAIMALGGPYGTRRMRAFVSVARGEEQPVELVLEHELNRHIREMILKEAVDL